MILKAFIKISPLVLVLTLLLASWTSSPYFNKEEVYKLSNKYIDLLQISFNQKSSKYFFEVDSSFREPRLNDHIYDISEKLPKEAITFYLSDVIKDPTILEINIEPEALNIFDCIYFDPTTSKNYVFASLPKEISWKNKPSKKVTHLLMIDVTTSDYKIIEVFEFDTVKSKKYVEDCLNNKKELENQAQVANQVDLLYNEVVLLYEKKEYILALYKLNQILTLNPKFQDGIDAIDNIKKLTSELQLKSQFDSYLNSKNFKQAAYLLKLITEYEFLNENQIALFQKDYDAALKKIELENNFNKANYFFENDMHQLALAIYLDLKNEGFTHNQLDSRIQTCREADPAFVEQKLKAAFDAAVTSSKNWHETFRTYYKFETSGLLKGTNYRFMCLMMIDKKNNALLKSLNMPVNQSKNLAIKYYYKAQEQGMDMRDVETRIFTKNFRKKFQN